MAGPSGLALYVGVGVPVRVWCGGWDVAARKGVADGSPSSTVQSGSRPLACSPSLKGIGAIPLDWSQVHRVRGKGQCPSEGVWGCRSKRPGALSNLDVTCSAGACGDLSRLDPHHTFSSSGAPLSKESRPWALPFTMESLAQFFPSLLRIVAEFCLY